MTSSLWYSCCLLTLTYFSCSIEYSQIYIYICLPTAFSSIFRDPKTCFEDINHNLTSWHLLLGTSVICWPWPTYTLCTKWPNLLKLFISIFQRPKDFLERNFKHPYIITLSSRCQSCLLTLTYFSGSVEQSQIYICLLCLISFLRD